MIVETFGCYGIGPYVREPVRLDFRSIPSGSIIAVVGTNGAGKTHLLELMAPGALFQEFPSDRPPTGKIGAPLASHVRPTTPDAWLEVTYRLGGRPVTIHLDINGKRNKTEGYIEYDGQRHGPLIGQVREQIKKLFQSRTLFMVGPYACQHGYDGFSRVQQQNRRGVFAEMLGHGHYAVLHDRLDPREKALLTELDGVRTLIEELDARRTLLDTRRIDLGAATDAAAAAGEALIRLRDEHADATNAHQTARDTLLRSQATQNERTRLESELASVGERIEQAAGRLAELEALLANGEEIRDAAARLANVDMRLDFARGEERDAGEDLPRLEAAVATATAERDRAATEYRRIDGERAAAVAAAARLTTLDSVKVAHAAVQQSITDLDAEITAHDARTPELSTRTADASAALATHDEATADLEVDAQQETAARARRRELTTRRDDIVTRHGMLSQIPNVPECATCPFTTNAHREIEQVAALDAELATLPVIEGTPAEDRLRAHRRTRVELESARGRAQAAERQHTAARTVLDQRRRNLVEQLAAKAEQLAAGDVDRSIAAREPELDAALATALQSGTTARAALDAAVADRDAAIAERTKRRTAVSALEAERTPLAEASARLPELSAAKAQHTEIATALRHAQTSRADLLDAVASLPAASRDEAEAAVATATQRLDELAAAITDAEGTQTATMRTHAALDSEVQRLGDPATDLERQRAREAAVLHKLADVRVLQRALGPKGIPALLIDAAGPSISGQTNLFIAADYTPRFQIALTTTRPLASGKGVEEVFDYRILDAEAGREGTRGSGGEMALIDSALRFSVIIENVRRSGFETGSLFLDEPTSTLSQENTPKYVQMIRHAMRVGAFHHAWVVTHSPEIMEQADARIIVEDGGARLFIPGVTMPATEAA